MGTPPDDKPTSAGLEEKPLEPAQLEPAQLEPEQLELDSPRPSSRSTFWQRHGFETHEDWIAYLGEVNSVDVFGRREIPDVGVPSLSEVSRAALERELAKRRGYRQVGVKLRPDDYDTLCDAADAHGIAPSTLARILVVRGARALAPTEPGRAKAVATPPPRNESAA